MPDRRPVPDLDTFMAGLERRNPGEPEFHQAVREVAESVLPFVARNPEYHEARILERMTEPDRIVSFRVVWEDDHGGIRVDRAWRVQFNSAIGPYKGGLRFHPSVDLSVLKFLGFEQGFKNALTGLPMGGAKGGSCFDPSRRSEREIMRFCQSLMTELHRHIGEDVDVPAGDIGVGQREVSYLFGQYKRLTNRFAGTMTGKGQAFGGSAVRTEATGWGAVYFAEAVLGGVDDGLDGRRALVSGAGNVARYCVDKLIAEGATPLTMSDSDGTVVDRDGIDAEKLAWIHELKETRRGRIREYAEAFDGVEYHEGATPWQLDLDADVAFPCATQNELDRADAKALVASGVRLVVEGANMPCTAEAVAVLRDSGVLFAPGKAANAGGVAVSGLEQSQNAQRLSWSAEEVDRRLRSIVEDIHDRCVAGAEEVDAVHGAVEGRGPSRIVDYAHGANVAGFRKVADAMLAYGIA